MARVLRSVEVDPDDWGDAKVLAAQESRLTGQQVSVSDYVRHGLAIELGKRRRRVKRLEALQKLNDEQEE